MAFTETFLQQQLWTDFSFYESGGVNGAFKTSLAPGKTFGITAVMLHLSTIHLSVEDFVVYVSSAKGSAFNQILYSQAMSDVKDFLWRLATPMKFDSTDQIIFSLFIKSATNTYGLVVEGWAIGSNA